MPDTQKLPTTLPESTLDRSIATLHEGKLASPSSAAYIKALIHQHHGLWWRTIVEDMESDDPKIRRSAQIEFNKLQCRVLPTELTSPEDGGITVKVLNYYELTRQTPTDKPQAFIDASFTPSTSSSNE